MDQDLRARLADALANESPDSLVEVVSILLRAGQTREAGWALRAGLMGGVTAPGSILDALTPSLEDYVADPLREYPRQDLSPARVDWLPDGRLAVAAYNAHVIDALDLETGAHEPIYRGSERPAHEFLGSPRALNWFFVERDRIWIGSEEDLPDGGDATTRGHWFKRSLEPGETEVQHCGLHGERVLVGRYREELLGLARGRELFPWRPGEALPGEESLSGTSLRLAPGTCVRRTGQETLSFHSPDGREELAEVPFPGALTQRWDGIQAAWGGRAQVRDASLHGLLLCDPSGVLQRAELPEAIPAETWWAHYPHPSGLLAAVRVSGLTSQAFYLLDLRSGAARELSLPKHASPGDPIWSPCGALALPTRQGILTFRPRA